MQISWSNEQTSFLIDQYMKYPCLYVVKHKDYHNKRLQSLALQKVVDAMKSMRQQVNKQEIVKKFLGLRSTYSNERKKVLNSLHSGMSGDEVYKPALWYYDRMSFLNKHLSLRASKSLFEVPNVEELCTADTQSELNIDVDVTKGHYEIAKDASLVLMSRGDASGSETSSRVQSLSTSRSTMSSPVPDRNRKQEDTDVEILGAVSKSLSTVAGIMQTSSAELSRSSEDVFGEFIAMQLKKIKNDEIKSEVQYQIHGLLRDALNSNKDQ